MPHANTNLLYHSQMTCGIVALTVTAGAPAGNGQNRRRSMHDSARRASAFGRDNSVNIEQSLNRTAIRNSVAAIANLPSFNFDNLQGEAKEIGKALMHMPSDSWGGLNVVGEGGDAGGSVDDKATKSGDANIAPSVLSVPAELDVSSCSSPLSTGTGGASSPTGSECSSIGAPTGGKHNEVTAELGRDISSGKGPVDEVSSTNGRNECGAEVESMFVATPSDAANTDESLVENEAATRNLHQMQKQTRFRRNIRVLVTHPDITPQAKASRMVTMLEDMLGPYWLKARHIANVVELFEIGMVEKVEGFGTYRVELVVSLFPRLVDVHNFEIVLNKLSPEEAGCVYARLGWLNIFNPMKPEGSYCLDLSVWEERQVAKGLIVLAVAEPGDNIMEGKFQWNRESEPVPGWVLPQIWTHDETLPAKGILQLRYYSGEGRGLNGCKPNVLLRRSLLQMVSNCYDVHVFITV